MCEKEHITFGICPYCRSSSFYDCRENGDQIVLCLNCGQVFAIKDSAGADSRNQPSTETDHAEQ